MSEKERALAKALRERPTQQKDIFGRGGYTVTNTPPDKQKKPKPKRDKVLNASEQAALDEMT